MKLASSRGSNVGARYEFHCLVLLMISNCLNLRALGKYARLLGCPMETCTSTFVILKWPIR